MFGFCAVGVGGVFCLFNCFVYFSLFVCLSVYFLVNLFVCLKVSVSFRDQFSKKSEIGVFLSLAIPFLLSGCFYGEGTPLLN